uniref:Legume lectin domain-containing protein n=1 Tax=Triticum urartu TaxID=4572 RepID=A0A8R7R3B8_TRIUA
MLRPRAPLARCSFLLPWANLASANMKASVPSFFNLAPPSTMGQTNAKICFSIWHTLWMPYYAPHWAFSLSFNLNFSDPSAGSWVDLDGDAYIARPRLELTKNVLSSIGRASYRHKVPLWNGATGEMASFATNFSFRIMPEKAGLTGTGGDGMAFFIAHFPSEIPPNNKGGGLGLLPAYTNGTGRTRVMAVEFDTLRNSHYADINDNHIGIDISSVNSMASTDTTTRPGRNLTSSYVMVATVRYHNESRMLAVDLLIDDA